MIKKDEDAARRRSRRAPGRSRRRRSRASAARRREVRGERRPGGGGRRRRENGSNEASLSRLSCRNNTLSVHQYQCRAIPSPPWLLSPKVYIRVYRRVRVYARENEAARLGLVSSNLVARTSFNRIRATREQEEEGEVYATWTRVVLLIILQEFQATFARYLYAAV